MIHRWSNAAFALLQHVTCHCLGGHIFSKPQMERNC